MKSVRPRLIRWGSDLIDALAREATGENRSHRGREFTQLKGPTMSISDLHDLTTWSDGSLLALVDELRKKIAGETNDDVLIMRGYRLDEALAEVRRRNEARARTIAEAKLS